MRWYSIAIPQWRKAKSRNIIMIDVTVKSGDKRFAPFEEILWAYKRGEVTDDRYTDVYLDKMQTLLLSDPRAFETLLEPEGTDDMTEYAIACYCTAGKFCHRHLLISVMRDVAEDNGIHFEYCGEIV